jgi:AraC-like DNA-binding protein
MAKQHFNIFTDLVWMVTEEGIYKDEISPEFHSFVRIISGEMKVIQADQTYEFGPGSTLLFPRNQLSAVIKQPRDGRPYKAVVFGLTVDRLKNYYLRRKANQSVPVNHSPRIFQGKPLLESFFASVIPYFDLEDKLPEDIANLKFEEALSILRHLDPAIDGLLNDFSEPGRVNLPQFMEKYFRFNMPLEKFAYFTGRSQSTFIRDFKRTFKQTPQRWLTQKRLELAHEQLTKTGRKAAEIYLETGFENLSHFSFAFKKQYGYPPASIAHKNQ